MGLVFFFPGFWKLRTSGLNWVFSENLKFHLYEKWLQFSGWTPVFRIDRYPFLYQLAALGTVVFEISFIFLVLSQRLRILAVLGGIVFHILSGMFMRLLFWSLLACYVAFVDWYGVFRRIGCLLYREEMVLIYDGNCALCRRTIWSLQVFDVFGRVAHLSAQDKEAIASYGLQGLDSSALMADIHAIVGRTRWTGFRAYRALAARIPILWPVLPLLYIWPIPMIGERLYRHGTDTRTCRTFKSPVRWKREAGGRPMPAGVATVVVGVILLSGNIFYGIRGETRSWPFACYPKFDHLKGPQKKWITIDVVSATGEIIPLETQGLSGILFSDRWRGLIRRIFMVKNPVEQQVRLKALWQAWARDKVMLQNVNSVRFYETTLLTIPERQRENPVRRELLFEFNPQAR